MRTLAATCIKRPVFAAMLILALVNDRVTRRDIEATIKSSSNATRYLEASCPRLLALQKLHAAAMTIYRTGAEARRAMDPLVIADGRHMLHRFHIDQPRAALAIEMPATVRPWLMRFEEIWATGEPGLNPSVLGL